MQNKPIHVVQVLCVPQFKAECFEDSSTVCDSLTSVSLSPDVPL